MRLDRLCIAALCLSLTAVAAAQRDKLQVGDEAPGLDIDTWVKGDAVTIETGKVYVVEFWATWCVPCRKSIPHLTELQEEHGDRGLTIIGVSKEEKDLVERFVTKQGDNMDYTVAVDRKDSTTRAWFTAAGLEGIPAAFVVDQKGKIAFIGHPLSEEFESVLDRVMMGRYDPELERRAAPLLKVARENRKVRNWRVATMHYDRVIELNQEIFAEIALERAQMMLVDMGDRDGAYQYARNELINGMFRNDPGALEMLAERIVGHPDIADKEKDLRDLDVALEAAEAAGKLRGPTDPNAMALLAKVRYHRGEIDEAITLQKRAYFRAGPKQKEKFRRVLTAYQEAAARAGAAASRDG